MFDAIIIGGSYAGLSAGLQLARARRRIAVIDAGSRRNRFAEHAHGFLAQDGRPPGEIVADGRAQLLAYPNVEWFETTADGAERRGDGFAVKVADGSQFEARRLVLALGVTDELPAVPGLAERWGRSVFHCPYCDGYELERGQIGVLAVSAQSIHHALMLPDWGPTTFFLNDSFMPDAEQVAQLQKRGVTVEPVPIRRITGGRADIELGDGRVIEVEGLFTLTRTSPSSGVAEMLGCAMEEGATGSFIATNGMRETSVPGVFACGDAARAFGSVALAVGDGAMTGSSTHQSLIFRDL